MRWTRAQSFVAVTGLTGAERDGPVRHARRRTAEDPRRRRGSRCSSATCSIGTIDVQPGFRTYSLPLPAAAVEAAGRIDEPTQLRLVSSVWSPRQILNLPDDRDLGVMIDRIEVR